jgi:hypothetical protein
MIVRGTGVYEWYWGAGEQPALFHGPYPSGDLASAGARSDHDGDFTIVEADRHIPTVQGVFNADGIFARFRRVNGPLWMRRPKHKQVTLTRLEKAELVGKLEDTLDRWVRKHGLDDHTTLRHIRKRDYFPNRPRG